MMMMMMMTSFFMSFLLSDWHWSHHTSFRSTSILYPPLVIILLLILTVPLIILHVVSVHYVRLFSINLNCSLSPCQSLDHFKPVLPPHRSHFAKLLGWYATKAFKRSSKNQRLRKSLARHLTQAPDEEGKLVLGTPPTRSNRWQHHAPMPQMPRMGLKISPTPGTECAGPVRGCSNLHASQSPESVKTSTSQGQA